MCTDTCRRLPIAHRRLPTASAPVSSVAQSTSELMDALHNGQQVLFVIQIIWRHFGAQERINSYSAQEGINSKDNITNTYNTLFKTAISC